MMAQKTFGKLSSKSFRRTTHGSCDSVGILITIFFLSPRWNFAKFLVDHEGNPFKRYGPKTNPDEMVADIEELLAKRNGK
jgi:glutathione peroxidase-family protein